VKNKVSKIISKSISLPYECCTLTNMNSSILLKELTSIVTLQGEYHSPLSMLTIDKESVSMIIWWKCLSKKYCRPCLIVIASTFKLEESANLTPLAPTRLPLWSLTQKATELGPELPLESPSVLHFDYPVGGGDHLTILWWKLGM